MAGFVIGSEAVSRSTRTGVFRRFRATLLFGDGNEEKRSRDARYCTENKYSIDEVSCVTLTTVGVPT